MLIEAKDFIDQNIGLDSLELLERYKEHILESVTESVTESVENVNYDSLSIGCGIEDCSIEDRYEASEYGWNECVKSVSETVENLK